MTPNLIKYLSMLSHTLISVGKRVNINGYYVQITVRTTRT